MGLYTTFCTSSGKIHYSLNSPLGWGQSNRTSSLASLTTTPIFFFKKRPDTSNSTSGVQCGRMHGVAPRWTQTKGNREPKAGRAQQASRFLEPNWLTTATRRHHQELEEAKTVMRDGLGRARGSLSVLTVRRVATHKMTHPGAEHDRDMIAGEGRAALWNVCIECPKIAPGYYIPSPVPDPPRGG